MCVCVCERESVCVCVCVCECVCVCVLSSKSEMMRFLKQDTGSDITCIIYQSKRSLFSIFMCSLRYMDNCLSYHSHVNL